MELKNLLLWLALHNSAHTLFIIKAFSLFYSLYCISPFGWAYVSPSQKGAAFSCWWRGSSWMYLPPFLNRFHEEEEVRRRRNAGGELITRVSVWLTEMLWTLSFFSLSLSIVPWKSFTSARIGGSDYRDSCSSSSSSSFSQCCCERKNVL